MTGNSHCTQILAATRLSATMSPLILKKVPPKIPSKVVAAITSSVTAIGFVVANTLRWYYSLPLFFPIWSHLLPLSIFSIQSHHQRPRHWWPKLIIDGPKAIIGDVTSTVSNHHFRRHLSEWQVRLPVFSLFSFRFLLSPLNIHVGWSNFKHFSRLLKSPPS